MCISGGTAALLALAAGTGAQLYGAGQHRKAQQRAMNAQMQQQNEQIMAEMRAAQDRQRAIMAANAAQRGIANESGQQIRQAIQRFSQPAQQQLLDERIGERRAEQRQVLSASQAAGQQTPGSKIEGRVSPAFGERQAAAEQSGIAKAQGRGELLSKIAGYQGLPQALAGRGTDLGAMLGLLAQRARDRQIADQLRIQQASIADFIPNRIVNTRSTKGDIFSGVGKGLQLYGAYGAPGFNTWDPYAPEL
jgi:hypothetical protein